jgi:transposase-like protein
MSQFIAVNGLAVCSITTIVKQLESMRSVICTIRAMKVVYLVIQVASKKWFMPIRIWIAALNHSMIEFPERMPETL